jgi:hypothetical protein
VGGGGGGAGDAAAAARDELESELARTSAALADMRRGLATGLSLVPLEAGINLDALVAASLARAKSKKLRLEPAELAGLQGERAARRGADCRARPAPPAAPRPAPAPAPAPLALRSHARALERGH